MKKLMTCIVALAVALSVNVSALAAGSITYPAEVSAATTATGNTVRPNAATAPAAAPVTNKTSTTTNKTTANTGTTNGTGTSATETPATEKPSLKAAALTSEQITQGFNAESADGAITMTAEKGNDGGVVVQADLKTKAGVEPVTVVDAKTAASLLNVVNLTAPKDESGALLVDIAKAPITEKTQLTFTADNAKPVKEMSITTNTSVADLIKSTVAGSDDAVKSAFGAAELSDADLENAQGSITIDANGDSYLTTDNGFVAKINTETVAEQEISIENYKAEDFPLTLDFSVPGAKPGMAYQVQHNVNGIWKMERTEVASGKVSAVVESMSPFRVTLTTLEPVGAVAEAVAPVAPEPATAEAASEDAGTDTQPEKFPMLPVAGIAVVVAAIAGVRIAKNRKKTTAEEKK